MQGKRLVMQKDDQGVWSVISDAMEPDSTRTRSRSTERRWDDPSNREFQTSWVALRICFAVPGPGAWLPDGRACRRAPSPGTCFHSAVAGDEREVFRHTRRRGMTRNVRSRTRLRLLHGLGDDAGRWVNSGGANNILDNAIASGKAVPMVLVSTLGYGRRRAPTARGPTTTVRVHEDSDRRNPAACGEGYNVARIGISARLPASPWAVPSRCTPRQPSRQVAWMATFSGRVHDAAGATPPAAARANALAALPHRGSGRRGAAAARAAQGAGRAAVQTIDTAAFAKAFPALDAKANAQISRCCGIVCGTADGLIGPNRQFKEWLKTRNVQFTEQEVPDMAHVWPLWRQKSRIWCRGCPNEEIDGQPGSRHSLRGGRTR